MKILSPRNVKEAKTDACLFISEFTVKYPASRVSFDEGGKGGGGV